VKKNKLDKEWVVADDRIACAPGALNEGVASLRRGKVRGRKPRGAIGYAHHCSNYFFSRTNTTMSLKKGEIIEVHVEKLALGGAGVGKCHVPATLLEGENRLSPIELERTEGLVTFVEGGVPGDHAEVSLTKIKKSFLEGKMVKLITPSPARIAPKCRHFETCGGCTFQNLKVEDQLRFKEQMVRETLEHVGAIPVKELDRVMRSILGCEDPWHYRNKIEVSFWDPRKQNGGGSGNLPPPQEGTCSDHDSRRTLLEMRRQQTPTPPRFAQELIQLGFHLPRQRHEVFDLEECHLASERMVSIVKKVREFVRAEKLEVFDERTGEGLLRYLMLREGKNTGELMVNLVTSVQPFPQLEAFKTLFAQAPFKDDITSLLWTTIMQSRGVPTWRESQVLSGQKTIYEELRLPSLSGKKEETRLRFEISPESFFQTNTHQAEKLYGAAIELAGLSGKEIVYDLYCGTGTIGLCAAAHAKKVYGIELVKAAVLNARKNALQNNISNIEFMVGDTSKCLKSLAGPNGTVDGVTLEKPDVVIVDPPRCGLDGDTPLLVAELKARKIVYVSCNPATLARDLKIFREQGYTLEAIQPVDMFPQTYHIENVALLSRNE